MSENSDTNEAWAWYDPEDGSLRHVTFIRDHTHPPGTEQIAIGHETATDILLGKSRLYEYMVVADANGTPTVTYRPITMVQHFAKFWNLQEEHPIPFLGRFNDATSFESPIRIYKRDHGYDIMVVSLMTKAKVYITLKNDPNYLIRTINIQDATEEYGLGPIPVNLDWSHDYSFYVRYHDAA